MKFSVFHRNGLGVAKVGTLDDPMDDCPEGSTPVGLNCVAANDASTQVQFTGGLSLIRDKLKLRLQTAYDADPEPGNDHFPEQHWQVLYSTQCCTFVVERLIREFASLEQRREVYFRVDLRGVGKLLEKTW